jgi:hypothetical protein
VKDDFAEVSENPSVPEESAPAPSIMPKLAPLVGRTGKFVHSGLDILQPVIKSVFPFLRSVRRFFAKDSLPNMMLVMVLLATVAAAAAGLAYTAAEPRILAAREAAVTAAMTEVFPGERVLITPSSLGEDIFEARDVSGHLIGFSVLVSVSGYTDIVEMAVGIGTNRVVTGVEVIRHREMGDLLSVKNQGVAKALALLEGGLQP